MHVHLCACIYVALLLLCVLVCTSRNDILFHLLFKTGEGVLIMRSKTTLKPFSDKSLLWFPLIACDLNLCNKLYTISNWISTESLLLQEMKWLSLFHHFLFHYYTNKCLGYFEPSVVLYSYREWKGNTANKLIECHSPPKPVGMHSRSSNIGWFELGSF